jgi:hypothetical protein
MNTTRINMALFAMLCLSLSAWAQYDDSYDIEEWTLDDEEEEAPKPQHKEYKNAFYLQYSPSRYLVADESRIRFNEILIGYSRFIQVVEDVPFFVEAGANMKFSWETKELKARVLTFRIPVNITYKFYPWKDKDYAIAPYAGASIRAIAMAREHTGAESTSLIGNPYDWHHFQVAWQTGLRFYLNRYFLGVSYSRDFRDSSKYPGVRECGVHFGCCF